MRKLVYIGASWCSPCKAFKKKWYDPIAEEAPEHCEFIDSKYQSIPYGIKVSRIPTVAVVIDDKVVRTFNSGVYPTQESVISYLLGVSDDFS